MSTFTIDYHPDLTPGPPRVARRVWREIKRQFQPRVLPSARPPESAAASEYYLTGTGASVAGFHPQQATVESGGIPLIQSLVRESRKYPGPIIEVGTLLGITTTNMALVKAQSQKIITVDFYCWNPWGWTPDVHEAVARQMLYYLSQTGHVDVVRMDKNDFFRDYKGPAPSMVFLDAVHDYEETKKDIVWAKRAGAKIIAGHDYCDVYPGVQKVVDEFGGPRELSGTVWSL
jgi:hypothetical protein